MTERLSAEEFQRRGIHTFGTVEFQSDESVTKEEVKQFAREILREAQGETMAIVQENNTLLKDLITEVRRLSDKGGE